MENTVNYLKRLQAYDIEQIILSLKHPGEDMAQGEAFDDWFASLDLLYPVDEIPSAEIIARDLQHWLHKGIE